MARILFILPIQTSLEYARNIILPVCPDSEFITGSVIDAIPSVRQRLASGLKIVAARSMAATAIRSANLGVAVVEIPRTGFDILRAIEHANLSDKKLAFFSYPEKIWGIELFKDALGVDFRQYIISYKTEYEKELLNARANGIDVVLGGFTFVEAARRHQIPYILIKLGQESLLQTAEEVKKIDEALQMESARNRLLTSIQDYSYDGIIAVDKNGIIIAFNPLAENLTNISRSAALGTPIEITLPFLHLTKVIKTKRNELYTLIDLSHCKLMCNKVPIIDHGEIYGAVATFQAIGKIQEMEAKIRRQIYAREPSAKFQFKDVLGNSPSILNTIEIAKDFAATDYSVLISGETGTGKEVFAQSIHNASRRATGPFIAINCAALPTQILESELFGYVGGAFTGANKEGKIGLFEAAHGGTIFLDEISEMDYLNQGRLLRVLQEKSIMRLGSRKLIPIDVRIIAATNKNLPILIEKNAFRADLYYRLNVLMLELPPLRLRTSDIRLYTEIFAREFTESGKYTPKFTSKAIQFLESYAWPGNVRELKNSIGRVIVTAKKPIIDDITLRTLLSVPGAPAPTLSKKEQRQITEIEDALKQARGNYIAAAEILGIHRATLWRRMKKFHLE